jgi:hypothetical protein
VSVCVALTASALSVTALRVSFCRPNQVVSLHCKCYEVVSLHVPVLQGCFFTLPALQDCFFALPALRGVSLLWQCVTGVSLPDTVLESQDCYVKLPVPGVTLPTWLVFLIQCRCYKIVSLHCQCIIGVYLLALLCKRDNWCFVTLPVYNWCTFANLTCDSLHCRRYWFLFILPVYNWRVFSLPILVFLCRDLAWLTVLGFRYTVSVTGVSISWQYYIANLTQVLES